MERITVDSSSSLLYYYRTSVRVCVVCRWWRVSIIVCERGMRLFFFFYFPTVISLVSGDLWPRRGSYRQHIFGGHHKRTKCISSAGDVDPWRFLNAPRAVVSAGGLLDPEIHNVYVRKAVTALLLHLLYIIIIIFTTTICYIGITIIILYMLLKRAKRFQRLHAHSLSRHARACIIL